VEDVRVREATREDVPTMADIGIRGWRFAYAGHIPPDALDRLSLQMRLAYWGWRIDGHPNDQRTWVADRDGRVIGFCFTGPRRDEDLPETAGEVQSLYLDPDEVGRGVGRLLFAHAVADLVERGHDPIVVWVHTENARARRFYERAGFHPDGAEHVEDYEGTPLPEVRYRLATPSAYETIPTSE
jgi:GNAT superfamily N-acetyltransferase